MADSTLPVFVVVDVVVCWDFVVEEDDEDRMRSPPPSRRGAFAVAGGRWSDGTSSPGNRMTGADIVSFQTIVHAKCQIGYLHSKGEALCFTDAARRAIERCRRSSKL